jgi:hypothetical protein
MKGTTLAGRRARAALFYAQALQRAAYQGEVYARACALCGRWPPEGEGALRALMAEHAKSLLDTFPDPGPMRQPGTAVAESDCANSPSDLHNGTAAT